MIDVVMLGCGHHLTLATRYERCDAHPGTHAFFQVDDSDKCVQYSNHNVDYSTRATHHPHHFLLSPFLVPVPLSRSPFPFPLLSLPAITPNTTK